jgi:phosphatidylglycerol:prolipoprotein diacylglycerol transferase
MRKVLFEIWGFSVPSFWAMAFLGFFAGFLAIRNDVLRRGLPLRMAYDITLWAYVGGWVGARLFLIPTGWQYFVANPFRFLISSSGWVWYGGLIGGAVAVWMWARKEKLAILMVADIVAPALAIGLAIGRIGCQLAGDGDYGVPTDLPWGMRYPNGVVPTTERVHPAPLYEMLGLFILFAYLWRRRWTAPFDGYILGQYLLWSGLLRLSIEFVRRNPAWLIGLTTAQWMSIGSMVIGVVLIRGLTGASGKLKAES